ncbi:hypothetical protein AOLI_G00060620 [Acnodon oligacanthus]
MQMLVVQSGGGAPEYSRTLIGSMLFWVKRALHHRFQQFYQFYTSKTRKLQAFSSRLAQHFAVGTRKGKYSVAAPSVITRSIMSFTSFT